MLDYCTQSFIHMTEFEFMVCNWKLYIVLVVAAIAYIIYVNIKDK